MPGGPPTWVPGFVPPVAVGNSALQLNGTNDYVTFGAAPSLGLTTFTLEAWIKRTGTGTGVPTTTSNSTGGGLQSVVPIISKGRGEIDNADNRDTNYILGIDTVSNKLAVDFEEGAAGSSPSQNHSFIGNTAITSNVWHHVAATYDGTWRLYLDGADGFLVVNQPPRADSIQHAGIGTAMTSTGVAAGFFARGHRRGPHLERGPHRRPDLDRA